MDRTAYHAARRAYRRACYLDRAETSARWADAHDPMRDGRAFLGLQDLITDRQRAVVDALSPRDRIAVLSRPYRPFNESQRLPKGPRAQAIYRRPMAGAYAPMDLNKRVALKRAIREVDAAHAQREILSKLRADMAQENAA